MKPQNENEKQNKKQKQKSKSVSLILFRSVKKGKARWQSVNIIKQLKKLN